MADEDAAMSGPDVLRACLRLRYQPEAAPAVRALLASAVDDWEAFLTLAEAERVAPLLHNVLGKLGILPPEIADVLQRSYRLTGIQNLVRSRELGHCLRALASAGLPVIVLKGTALVETVYGNVALRPMCDVDLLIERPHMSAIHPILHDLGYQLERAETHPGVLAEHENEVAFRKPGTIPTSVDVHWSLFDSPYYQQRISMDWFWQTAQPRNISGVDERILGPEALIIHLCGHLALHHTGTGLLWWHDIAEALTFYAADLDWQTLLARTQEYGLILPVREVLTQLASDWHVAIPESVLDRLHAMQPTEEEQRLFGRHSTPRPAGQRFMEDLGSMTDWRARLRFARTNLLPSADYMQRRYAIRHRWLVPIYYPYRWLRGLFGRA